MDIEKTIVTIISAGVTALVTGLIQYYFKKTNNSKVKYSKVILFMVGDVEPSTNNTLMEIFPDPVQHELNVSWSSNAKETSFSIYDIFGKCVLKENRMVGSGQNVIKFEIPVLSTGIYFLSLEENGILKTIKFIKD